MSFEKKDKPKILLTGACGFVGSNISKRLQDAGYASTDIDNLQFGNHLNAGRPFRIIGFEDLTEKFINAFDILIHCATSNIIYAMDKPIETFQNNATNTIKLFQRFKGKIIYTSTASVYGQATVIPTPEDAEIRTNNAYDQSKYIAELFLQQRGNYTTLRLSNVYGTNQRADNPFCGVMGKLIHGVLSGETIKINGNGMQTRDYTFIEDVVDAIMIAIERQTLNTEINIANGKESSIIQLIKIISDATDTLAHYDFVPQRKIDGITRRCLDVAKAEKILGWKPNTSIDEGIRKTIEWMKMISH